MNPPGTPPAPPGREPLWQVRLLGALEARRGLLVISRFPNRAAAALLARIALEPGRAHAREELLELLWPGAPPQAARNRLRQALSVLKSALRVDGISDVLQADRSTIRALPGALDSDVRQFDRWVREGNPAAARAVYGGELMPGFYEDWVLEERRRLAALFERLDQRLVSKALQEGVPPLPSTTSGEATVPTALRASAAAAKPPSGLPHYWTRSVGSELAASRLSILVRGHRLVTVHGPGGSGKTRLAVEVARALRDDPAWGPQASHDTDHPALAEFFDRVSFVPLVDCVHADQTLDAICMALQLEADGGRARSRIEAALDGGRTLLLLDNLEQLDADATQEIAHLLRTSSGLHVLATSRLLLDLDGEQAFELDGLALPTAQATLDEAATNPAVMLFVDRARAARGDFHLGPHNLRSITGLTRLLGGMPLAIELAASRVRSLAPGELLQRLSLDGGTPMLDLLARNAQRSTAGGRHASMRHVVDWSWRQLAPDQAALMAAMTVFGAPAQLATVAAAAGRGEAHTLTQLEALGDACLVRSLTDPQGPTRFWQQQPVREFATERCTIDAARVARQRVRRWLIDFATQAASRGQAVLASQIAPEMPHVHAAIVSAPGDAQGDDALQLALALRQYWESDDLPTSCLQALEAAWPSLQDAHRRADALELLAMACGAAGLMPKAEGHADAALALARGNGDERRLALALARWAWTHYLAGRFDTPVLMRAVDEASVLARRCGDDTAQGMVLRVQAPLVSNLLRDYGRAERLSLQGQQVWERAGNLAMARVCLLGRATMWAWLGREEEALPLLKQCEEAALAHADWVGWLTGLRQTGRVHVRLRQWPQAVTALRQAVQLGWQRRYARGLANALLNLPEALLMAGHPLAAAQLHAFALAHWARLYGAINPIEAAEQRRARRLLRLALGPARAEALQLQGSALELPAAVGLALDVHAA